MAPGSAIGPWQLPCDSVTMAKCLVLSALGSSSKKWGVGTHLEAGKLLEIRAPAPHRARHLAAENRWNLPRGLARCWGGNWGGWKSGSC